MAAARILKTMVPPMLKSLIKRSMGLKTMEGRLLNLRHAGFHCTGAIDVGAYHGEWSRGLSAVWTVPILMVEPQVSCAAALESFASNLGANSVYFEQCALGKEAGSVEFMLEETNSRMVPNGEAANCPTIRVPVRTLREVVSSYQGAFNLLKVDVQGFELDVLEGAGELLQQFEVVILEVSVIRIGPVPTFYEVMQYMDGKGYRLYDFLPMYYRPLDNALWQGTHFSSVMTHRLFHP